MANTVNVELHSLNQDLTFAAKGKSGHWLMIDTNKEVGGNAAGNAPLEMLLQALGGCTGMDVISILKKKRTPFSKLDIYVDAEKRDEHPKIFTKINLRFVLHSGGGEKALKDLERAVGLSYEKYCTVANMLKNTSEISLVSEIKDE